MGDTWTIQGGMLGKLAAAGTAAVAKCVAPGGATHEQVDVAAARRQPRRAHAPQARQWRAAGA